MAIALLLAAALSSGAQAHVPASTVESGNPPADLPQGVGPRGTSGEQRYDAVGYAGVDENAGDSQAVSATSDAVPQGSFVELTALDSGKTIVATVSGRGTDGGVVGLSPGAARLLGIEGGSAAVRVRGVTPSPQDQVALRGGHSASSRLDAPASLLVALRKRLPASVPTRAMQRPLPRTRQTAPPGAPFVAPDSPPARDPAPLPEPALARHPGVAYAPPRRAPAPAPIASGWYVQVAALSSLDRAQALVASLGGGRVVSSGGIHRVQIGPYGNAATAGRARDDAARRGYGGARVVHD